MKKPPLCGKLLTLNQTNLFANMVVLLFQNVPNSSGIQIRITENMIHVQL